MGDASGHKGHRMRDLVSRPLVYLEIEQAFGENDIYPGPREHMVNFSACAPGIPTNRTVCKERQDQTQCGAHLKSSSANSGGFSS